MLSRTDNDKITQTGPGTPMGDVFRRFWIPALLSRELSEPDCAPVRFMLLNERLVAFRDTSGKIGILEERCPHRHASLYWGRNEEGGLRCVYHGWKFNTAGDCLDQPAEPEDSKFKDHLHAIAYEVHEAGGIIWIYMGPKDKVPPFPEFEFTLVPDENYAASKRLVPCNWLQNLEGELDTSHAAFLHRSNIPEGDPLLPPSNLRRKRYIVSETSFGMLAMARSDEDDNQYYWRMTPFHLPSFTLIPGSTDPGRNFTFTGAVPLDDTHMWGFTVTWNPSRPLTDEESGNIKLEGVRGGIGPHVVVKNDWTTEANKENDYLIDRELQRSGRSFTGIPGTRVQDLAVQEDQDGPICRRFEEHLGTTDRAIVGARRLLLNIADALQEGIEPPQAQNAKSFRIHSVAVIVPRDDDPVAVWEKYQPVPTGTTVYGAVS